MLIELTLLFLGPIIKLNALLLTWSKKYEYTTEMDKNAPHLDNNNWLFKEQILCNQTGMKIINTKCITFPWNDINHGRQNTKYLQSCRTLLNEKGCF